MSRSCFENLNKVDSILIGYNCGGYFMPANYVGHDCEPRATEVTYVAFNTPYIYWGGKHTPVAQNLIRKIIKKKSGNEALSKKEITQTADKEIPF